MGPFSELPLFLKYCIFGSGFGKCHKENLRRNELDVGGGKIAESKGRKNECLGDLQERMNVDTSYKKE